MRSWDNYYRACLGVLTVVALTVTLVYTRTVLLPFTIALFAYSILSPMVKGIQGTARLNRGVAIGLTFLIFTMAFGTLITFVGHSLGNFFQSAGAYGDRIILFGSQMTEVLEGYGVNLNWSAIKKMLADLPIFHMAGNFSGIVLSIISNSFFVTIFVLFMLAGEGKNGTNGKEVFFEIKKQIARYAMTKFLTSFATGLLVGVVLGLFKVDLAFMFAVITILFNFIPSIGSIASVLLIIPVLLLQFGLTWQFYFILLVCGMIQFVIGNVFEPKVMGRNLDLHPVTIMLFLMFWGLIWGIPGMFLAVPITAVMKIVFSKIEATHFLANLLSGKLA